MEKFLNLNEYEWAIDEFKQHFGADNISADTIDYGNDIMVVIKHPPTKTRYVCTLLDAQPSGCLSAMMNYTSKEKRFALNAVIMAIKAAIKNAKGE